jgi:hypothetical protein
MEGDVLAQPRAKQPLTHVQLAYEAGHVVVFEEPREDFARETRLIEHVEAVAGLLTGKRKAEDGRQCGCEETKRQQTGSHAISSSYFLSSTNVHSLLRNAGMFEVEYSIVDNGIAFSLFFFSLSPSLYLSLALFIFCLQKKKAITCCLRTNNFEIASNSAEWEQAGYL